MVPEALQVEPPLPTDGDVAWWSPLSVLRPEVPVRLPPPGRPLRVAFVGQRTYFRACSQTVPTRVIEPSFVEFRAGSDGDALRRRLDSLAPHVVVVFRPEVVPPGVLRGLGALTLGYLTEPLPRIAGSGDHPDLERRLQDLSMVDPGQFDRVIAFDPHIAGSAGRYLPVWRSQPLPVDDGLFSVELADPRPVRALFVGRATAHRDAFLMPAKHLYDLMHVEHGLYGPDLVEMARQFLVAVNLHNEPYPSFENRVPLHLAIGNLVMSEPLSPANGLDPDLDFLELRDPDDLVNLLGLVSDEPERFSLVRVRGRQKAEAFRASRVYARLVLDLLLDVAAFGTRVVR